MTARQPQSQPGIAELARKAALFREGTKRMYDSQGARADMWFFELWHFLGDVQDALASQSAPDRKTPQIIAERLPSSDAAISGAGTVLLGAKTAEPVITQAMAQFIMWAMVEGPWQGRDVDGGEAQEKALSLGLLTKTTYNPTVHGDSDCCKAGDDWYVPSEQLADALTVRRSDVQTATVWQPIETAPLDGSEILILTAIGATQARFAPGEWSDHPDGREYDGPVWVCCDDQWQIEIEDCGKEGMHHGMATHWQPLPASRQLAPALFDFERTLGNAKAIEHGWFERNVMSTPKTAPTTTREALARALYECEYDPDAYPWDKQTDDEKRMYYRFADVARTQFDVQTVDETPSDRLARAERALAIISYMDAQRGEDAMKMRGIATDVTLWDRPNSMWWHGKDYGPSLPSAQCGSGK